MARMHARRRGKSHSTRPPSKKFPEWLDLTSETVEQVAMKLSREGKKPSEIGTILRDHYGVPTFKQVTGVKLMKVLELASEMPGDLANLIESAMKIRRHLRQNTKDRKSRHSLELVEAKIHRLSKYYKRTGKLPGSWRYKSLIAKID
ncbi:MAG: 30S ribosomal protein S15 [Nitrososphaeria archaeon]|nr:30S ribosomal protein S15 [Nitrososphaeria archaeon]